MDISNKINHINQLVEDGKLEEAIIRLEAILEAHSESIKKTELYSLLCKLYIQTGRESDIPQDWIEQAKEVDSKTEHFPQEIGITVEKQTNVITEVRIQKANELIKINTIPSKHPEAMILILPQLNRLLYTIALIPPDARVLEVGCADGWLSRFLYHMKPEQKIVGVDIEEGLLEFARKRHPKDIEFCLLPELKGKYNVVLMCEVLEHIEHPEDLISTYIPYLKKPATFIISVPSSKFGYYSGHIHQSFTKQKLESILSKFTQDIKWYDNPSLQAWLFCKFTITG